MSEDELLAIAQGMLHLYDRPRVRLFARTDPFDRFVSVLLFMPRDRYDSDVRQTGGRDPGAGLDGRVSAYYPNFSTGPWRGCTSSSASRRATTPTPTSKALEAEIDELARTWRDRFDAALRGARQGRRAQVGELLARYAEAFPAGYRDRYDAAEALADLRVMEHLARRARPCACAPIATPDCTPSCSSASSSTAWARPCALADVLPILENMGLKAHRGGRLPRHAARATACRPVWVHEFAAGGRARRAAWSSTT